MAKQKQREIRRGDGSISERMNKNGSFTAEARWREDGVYRSKSFNEPIPHDASDDEIEAIKQRARDEAGDYLRLVGRSVRSGRYVPTSQLTVELLIEEYMQRMRGDWKSNTYANYRTIVDNIVYPAVGKKRAADLRPRDMRILFDRLRKKYSRHRLAVIRAVMSGAFTEAVELEILEINPLSALRLKQPERKPIEVWTDEEVIILLAYLVDDLRHNAWYRLALTTGMRPGELRALRWSDLDLNARTVKIHTTATRDENYRPIIGKSTKTGKTRVLKYTEETALALKRYRQFQLEERLRAEFWNDLDLVFPSHNGNLLSQQTHARRHRRICEDAGIRYLKPHGTRHTVATALRESGATDRLVADILGHSRTRSLEQYTHPTQKAHDAATGALESLTSVRRFVRQIDAQSDEKDGEPLALESGETGT